MESSEETTTTKPRPFDFGIRRFKKSLKEAGAPQSYINKAAKAYKEKVYTKVAEVRAEMEAEAKRKGSLLEAIEAGEKETEHAPDK